MSGTEDPPLAFTSALRLYVGSDWPLAVGRVADLPEAAARHAQVRRVQPGDVCKLFDGRGSDWAARVLDVGRKQVRVEVGMAQAVALELPTAVTLALVVPANERMDSLVEKATELGVACLQPLMSERSVLRLQGERAQRRQAHWQAVAVAACEQCGRATVPEVAPVVPLMAWLNELKSGVTSGLTSGVTSGLVGDPPALPGRTPAAAAPAQPARWLLSLHASAQPLAALATSAPHRVLALSGPEGGLSPDEEQAARAAGFTPVSLGPRVLRADTAPLAVLAWLGLQFGALTS